MHRETWGTFDDNKPSDLDVGARQGDLRAAMAPFLANITFREPRGVTSYLSGRCWVAVVMVAEISVVSALGN